MRPSIVVGLAVVALAGCSAWQVRVMDANAPTAAAHHTFAFGTLEATPGGYQPPTRANVALQRLEDAATRSLTTRGYRSAQGGHGDLVLRFGLGVKTTTRVAASPAGAGAGDSSMRTETDGVWTLEVFDEASGQRVWRGTAHGDLDPGDASADSMRDAVEQILRNFPRAPSV